MSAYIAFLDSNNVVTQVIQSPDDGQDWAAIWEQQHNCTCIVTAKDNSIRNKYAEVGDTYYAEMDAFIGPSPYPSWSLNKATKRWEAPVAMPDDEDLIFEWDEGRGDWVIVYDAAINGGGPF
jgi:hypothetical protein